MTSNFLQVVGRSRVYPLTDRNISGISHAEQVSRLSALGVSVIQLREKSLSSRDFYAETESAISTARNLGIKLIVNDRIDIALALKADGVHLGQDDLDPEVARRLMGPEAIIGISTHTLEQAQVASQMPVNYIAIGPVFPTLSKESPNAIVGLDGIRAVRNAIGKIPLVAIGGITLLSRREVLNAGADCVSIISDLWESPGHVRKTSPDHSIPGPPNLTEQ